jgi:hypothetical protein
MTVSKNYNMQLQMLMEASCAEECSTRAIGLISDGLLTVLSCSARDLTVRRNAEQLYMLISHTQVAIACCGLRV